MAVLLTIEAGTAICSAVAVTTAACGGDCRLQPRPRWTPSASKQWPPKRQSGRPSGWLRAVAAGGTPAKKRSKPTPCSVTAVPPAIAPPVGQMDESCGCT